MSMNTISKELTVGKLAEFADVNVETIRFYERKGLMPKPLRKPSGYRLYSQDDVKRLQFIVHAKDLGFSLREIKELLELRIDAESSCDDVREQAETKIADIERKIADLQRIHEVLCQLAAACRVKDPTSECPILEALDQALFGEER